MKGFTGAIHLDDLLWSTHNQPYLSYMSRSLSQGRAPTAGGGGGGSNKGGKKKKKGRKKEGKKERKARTHSEGVVSSLNDNFMGVCRWMQRTVPDSLVQVLLWFTACHVKWNTFHLLNVFFFLHLFFLNYCKEKKAEGTKTETSHIWTVK